MISAMEQSSASQMASKVEKRIAFALLFLRIDKFAKVMPTKNYSKMNIVVQSSIPLVIGQVVSTLIVAQPTASSVVIWRIALPVVDYTEKTCLKRMYR